jgi:hypothetical protein
MIHHLRAAHSPNGHPGVDCAADPVASLVQMFVGMVEAGRIDAGQCPTLRPVFLKPHGVVHGTFSIVSDLPPDLRVGLFAGGEYPAWVRFSSDTLPTLNDYLSTIGIGIKLFGVPGAKIFGEEVKGKSIKKIARDLKISRNTAIFICKASTSLPLACPSHA